MKHVNYVTQNVCSKNISFDLTDDGKIKQLSFQGGCNGNLKAISKLVEGLDARIVASILNGNTCGPRNTSCADQLSKAIEEALKS